MALANVLLDALVKRRLGYGVGMGVVEVLL